MRHLYILFLFFLIGQVQGQEQLNLLGTWADSSLVASTAHNNTYNEIWGIVVNDIEYAIIGSTYGTHFINVTDPENVEEVHRVRGAAQGTPIVHRDSMNQATLYKGVIIYSSIRPMICFTPWPHEDLRSEEVRLV